MTLNQNFGVVTGTLYLDEVMGATNANLALTPGSRGTLNNLWLG